MTFVILQSHSFPQWRARLGFMSRPEKCRNGEKCWMWSELGRERERWCWKSRNEESWLARSCTLDNYSTKPLSPATHHFNFQLLTVFNSFSRNEKTLTRMFENSHAQSRHWPWRWWLGKTLFCSLARWGWELCLNSHKKRCNYLRPGMISRRSGPGPGPHLGSTLARVKY